MQSKASGKWATYLACVPQILQSLHQHTCTHSDTHTRIPNPPLLLTNERIITFADMWRGGGEAEQGGTVHFSKQEMNSPCCGHLSPREGRVLAGCSVTQLPSKLQVWADTPVELAASLWSTSPPGKSLDRLLSLKRRTDEAIEGKDDKNPTDKLWCFTSLYFLLQKDSRPHNNKFYQLLYMRFRGYCYKLKTIYNQSPWTSFQ